MEVKMTTKKLNTAYAKWYKADVRAKMLYEDYETILNKYTNKFEKELKEKAKKDFHHRKISKTKDSYLMTDINKGCHSFRIYRLFNKKLDKEYMESVNSFEMSVSLITQTVKDEKHLVIKCEVFGHKNALLFFDYESFKRFVIKREWLKLEDIK